MRTTLNLDDELVEAAQEFTGIFEKTSLVREALKSLVEREASRRLAALGGTMPELEDIPRRREDSSHVMILADTTVWIDRFRSVNAAMQRQLNNRNLAIHPLIVAEVALGSLRNRAKTLNGSICCRRCALPKSPKFGR